MMLMDGLFSDPELAQVMNGSTQIATTRIALSALARVQAQMAIIPRAAATAICDAAAESEVNPGGLQDQIAQAGIPAQAVIKVLKRDAGAHGDWVSFAATSQDIQDTGLVLQLRDALKLLEDRMNALSDVLANQQQAYSDQIIPAHTRSQVAAPTTLGAKIAVWRAPLIRHLDRLDEMRPRLLCVALHGAAGTGAALAPKTAEVRAAFAADLGLEAPQTPWHTARDNIIELGGWLSLVTGSLGKMGTDLILMGRTGQVTAGRGGGSSTMPQKSNPVAAEALVTIARLNAGALGTLHHAMLHAEERDGAALGLEWDVLPGMIIRTGAALRLAQDLSQTMSPNRARIDAAFAQDRGAMMAEAAVFCLCREMPRSEAETIVAEALRRMDDNQTLAGALKEQAPGHDWAKLLAPECNTGDASAPPEDDHKKGRKT